MTDKRHEELDEYAKFEAAELAKQRAKGNGRLGAVLGVLIFGVLIFLFITKYAQEAQTAEVETVSPLVIMEQKAAEVGSELSQVEVKKAVVEQQWAQYRAQLDCIQNHSRRLVTGEETEAIDCAVTPEHAAAVFTQAQ